NRRSSASADFELTIVKVYTVIWKNGDDTLETDENVLEGSAPSYGGDEPAKAADAEGKYDKGPYGVPTTSLLNPVPKSDGGPGENVSAMAQRLIDTLKVFDVNAELAYYVAGPVVTQYALTLDLGTRVEKVAGLARNLQMALQATSLRIEAPIPGKNAVGIEVPNLKPASVHFREIIDGELWQKNSPGKFQVPLLLGKDAAGNDLVVDLAKLPHMLVAGATGQGKSVCLNSIINGLLMCRTPEQLRFIMVDPKRVEFTNYNRLPHLLVPIINDTNKVVFALRAALVEMEKRLKMFARVGCRNIVDFNTRKTVSQPDMFGGEEQLGDKDVPRTIPYIVIIIDEVADIMQAAGKEVEPVIARLTALARATGIHLILATQRPDTKVITGTIKSNIPGRIAFKTSSSIDSRTILDAQGSEQLIGKGDMLFKMSDGRLLRAQGAYISDDEINKIIDFIGEHSNPDFDETLTRRMEKIKEADPADSLNDDEDESEVPAPSEPMATAVVGGVPPPAGMTASKEEGLFRRALEVVRDTKRASISHLQRRMGIGYNHAARIMDLLEERGVIGPAVRGSGPREILIDPETLLSGGAGAPADPSDAPDAAFSLPPDPSEAEQPTI
ncbi:MAG: DNA translocase FtsK, partial [Kiritimatiellae bacterium]|nr:DNA translocase FtsK [Kiritimatiellia bacterium]